MPSERRNNNLLLYLVTLLMVWITDGSSGPSESPHESPHHHHPKRPGLTPATSHLLVDRGRPIIPPTGKCQPSFIPSDTDIDTPSLLNCVGLSNLTFTLNHIPSHIVSTVKSIHVSNSNVSILNLGPFHRFPRLQEISVIHSSVLLIRGSLPHGILVFNLSSNHIKHIDSSVFSPHSRRSSVGTNNNNKGVVVDSGELGDIKKPSTTHFPERKSETNDTVISGGIGSSDTYSALSESERDSMNSSDNVKNTSGESGPSVSPSIRVIDLSHNKITELPSSIFRAKSLQALFLAGNKFKCEFVWEKLWDWYETQPDPNILPDADDALCGVVDDVRVFQYTVLGVLKAKKDLEQTCNTVDKNLCPECSLYALQREGYPVSHKSSHGSISISLKIGCASRNLTQLPPVPPQTWQLNISHNSIRDLSPLKDPMYRNLIILDGDNNEINLETLLGTPFIEKYNYLSLQNNRFTIFPPEILSSFKTMRGQGVTFFGANFIDCDCTVARSVKPLLIENSKRIKDMRDIYCNEESNGDGYTRVMDLKFGDMCYLDTPDSSNEIYLYLVITCEVLLITLIITKVWYDQRTFRRTGILPWLSSCMPRLPCDAILESVKEPPNLLNQPNRPSVSVHSSSTNVLSHSGPSQFQLRGGSGSNNRSPHSDKSSPRQSQFSSLPSTSSRTSPV